MTSTNESSTGVTSVGPGTDITADPEALAASEADKGEEKPATSNAEQYREDGETLGGTGGLEAGGAG
jgi:hypothetical protein